MYASARWNRSEVVIAATETSTVTAIRGEDFFLRPFVLLGDVIFARALLSTIILKTFLFASGEGKERQYFRVLNPTKRSLPEKGPFGRRNNFRVTNHNTHRNIKPCRSRYARVARSFVFKTTSSFPFFFFSRDDPRRRRIARSRVGRTGADSKRARFYVRT
jgi:hypothetical protein